MLIEDVKEPNSVQNTFTESVLCANQEFLLKTFNFVFSEKNDFLRLVELW